MAEKRRFSSCQWCSGWNRATLLLCCGCCHRRRRRRRRSRRVLSALSVLLPVGAGAVSKAHKFDSMKYGQWTTCAHRFMCKWENELNKWATKQRRNGELCTIANAEPVLHGGKTIYINGRWQQWRWRWRWRCIALSTNTHLECIACTINANLFSCVRFKSRACSIQSDIPITTATADISYLSVFMWV